MARPTNLRRQLERVIGPGGVTDAPDVLRAHAGDRWFAAHPPAVVTLPRHTADVSKLLRFAHARSIPVTARGAGSGYVGGCVPVRGGIALSLARMNEIAELDPRDGVAVVGPGVVTARLQEAAAARGLFYPPDPASLAESSIGGNIATNAGGPRCLKYGVTRQYVLGLEVVLADGRVLQLGGRTHKNKTGFDLLGLFVGSEGLLGIVTRATLRLLPLPPDRAALAATFARFADAARAVERILAAGFLPAALEIADAFTVAAARRHLGAATVPRGAAHLMVETDGRRAAVAAEARELERLLRTLGARPVRVARGPAACDELWRLRRGFSESLRATGLTKLNEDIVVPRSRLAELVAFCEHLAASTGFPVACFGHAGDGNLHVNVMAENYADPQVAARVERALDRLFAQVLRWGGAITGEHGVGLAKKRWWPTAVSRENRQLHAALKRLLDPKGILNPGKFVS